MKAEKSESDGGGLANVPGLGFLTRIESGREVCFAHASDLLRAAGATQEQGLPNIAYHLANLALEEIGKAELIGLEAMGRTREETPSWATKHALDHTKKIFWSFFGALFGQKSWIRGSSTTSGLYVDLSDRGLSIPSEAVSKDDAHNLIGMASARLEMAKAVKLKPLEADAQDALNWFVSASEDPDKLKLIFGKKSLEKLAENNGDTREWMIWLREVFDKNEAENRALVQKELRRQLPKGCSAHTMPYADFSRFNSDHSLSSSALAERDLPG